jgi:hypothetical protein
MAESQFISLYKWFIRIAALFLVTFGVSPALAQSESSAAEDEWQFSAAVYLWGADIGGKTNRGSEVEVEFSDLLDNLEMALMGAFSARKNNWSLLTDIIYMDLAVDKTAELSIPIGPAMVPVTTAVSLDVEAWILHFAGGYNLYSEGKSRLDLIGGARYLDLDQTMFLSLQSLGPDQSRTISESLTSFDGIVGRMGNVALGVGWFLPYYVDVGAGDSKFTWQATAGIGYRAGRVVDLALVYRHLEWDFDSPPIVDDINFSGPTLGIIFRW